MFFIPLIFILLLPILADFWVKHNYKKYLKTPNSSGMSGKQIAQAILDSNELWEVPVKEVQGVLTDHYRHYNRTRSVNLSEGVFEEESIASIAIAAHECGHALQDRDGYNFMRFRSSMLPLVNFSNKFSYTLIIVGTFIPFLGLGWIGAFLLFCALVFQVVTLPVEFNASKRAMAEMERLGLVNEQDMAGVRSVLRSAALTYVAAVAASAVELLRVIVRLRRN